MLAVLYSPAAFAEKAKKTEKQKPYAIQEGDVVFSSSREGQGNAVIIATRSPYSHCGIVFQHEGKMMVLEAVQPVGVVSLKTFMSRSEPGTFMALRLKKTISPEKYQAARVWAMEQIGKTTTGDFCGMTRISIAPSWCGKPINAPEWSCANHAASAITSSNIPK